MADHVRKEAVLRERFFDSNGVRLHYIDFGGSGPPLILLAGLGGTAHIFRGLAPRLAERFRVAALTRRGHGRSDRPESGYALDTLVEDIRRFLDELGIRRAVLVGHSFAGIEIPAFAVRYPERVEAVVYIDAVNVLLEPSPDPGKDPVWTVLETQPTGRDLASPDTYLNFIKRSRPDLASIWCDAIEADRLADMTIVDGHPVFDRHGVAVTAKMFEGLGDRRKPDYAAVTAPTLALVLGGTTNPFIPPGAPDELQRAANVYYIETFRPWIGKRTQLFRDAAPAAQVAELDTSNHTLFIAREDETVQAIFDFLEA